MEIKSKNILLCDISGEVISPKEKISFSYKNNIINIHRQYFPRHIVDPDNKFFKIEALTVLLKNNTLLLRNFIKEHQAESDSYYIKDVDCVSTLINFAQSNTDKKIDFLNQAVDFIINNISYFDEKLCPLNYDNTLQLTSIYNIPIESEDLHIMQILKDNLKSLEYIKNFDSSIIENENGQISGTIFISYILETAWKKFMIEATEYINIYDYLYEYIKEENKIYETNKSLTNGEENFYIPDMQYDPYKMTLLESNKCSYKGFTYMDTIQNRFVYCVSNDNGSYMEKIKGVKKYVVINYSLKDFITQFNIFKYFKQYLISYANKFYHDDGELMDTIKKFGINGENISIPINKSSVGRVAFSIKIEDGDCYSGVSVTSDSKIVRIFNYNLNTYEGWISFITSIKALIEDDTMLKNLISMIEPIAVEN